MRLKKSLLHITSDVVGYLHYYVILPSSVPPSSTVQGESLWLTVALPVCHQWRTVDRPELFAGASELRMIPSHSTVLSELGLSEGRRSSESALEGPSAEHGTLSGDGGQRNPTDVTDKPTDVTEP